MKTMLSLALIAALGVTPLGFAADQAAQKTPLSSRVKGLSKADSEHIAQMDAQMKLMREMHEKMLAANTPEERNALMEEHRKSMHDGMSMMEGHPMMGDKSMMGKHSMMGGRMGPHSPHMMEKRMEMMQHMMQLMMDRMDAQTPAK
jgi:hypothetical protein